nr:4-oxalocrotonate tautomerase family protein [Massilia sp. Gc5]
MPYVNIKLIRDGLTQEKKATLIRSVTTLLETELNKNRANIVVVIDETDDDNWGLGGVTVTERKLAAGRQQQ